MPKSLQIFAARRSEICVWRGTDAVSCLSGLKEIECVSPSRSNLHACSRRCARRVRRFMKTGSPVFLNNSSPRDVFFSLCPIGLENQRNGFFQVLARFLDG